MSEKLGFEVYGDVDSIDWDPSEFVDCETDDELQRQLIDIAMDRCTWGIRIAGVSVGTLWEEVQSVKHEANE